MKTIGVCIPCNWDYIPMRFFASFMRMMIYAQARYEMLVMISRTSSVGAMREEAAREAIKNGADYILHLDVDEVYPPDTPEILMKHIDSGKDIVGGLYVARDNDVYSAFKFQDEPFDTVPMDVKPNTGLHKIDSMGMGGVMTTLDVYGKIESPWFDGVDGHGEDVAFCKKCRDAGIQIWLDTDLQYGHLTCMAKYP